MHSRIRRRLRVHPKNLLVLEQLQKLGSENILLEYTIVMFAVYLVIFLSVIEILSLPTSQVVDLGYARYQGIFNTTTRNTVFLGMRYAAPPTGDLQWKGPKFLTSLQEFSMSTHNHHMMAGSGTSPTSPFQTQALTSRAATANSEDRLFLNVFTPGLVSEHKEKLRVVFWIHGGGYMAGSVFGFLPGAAVKTGGSLNVWLLDQEFSLSGFKNTLASWLASMSCSSAANSLACLRAVDAGLLETANINTGISSFFGTFAFVLVIDGTFITQHPIEALKQRKVNGEVFLGVTNTLEGALSVDQSTASTVSVPNYVGQLFPNFGHREIAAAVAQYGNLGPQSSKLRLSREKVGGSLAL
ncbi:Acetylcholinesterase-1 [Hypsizygus marmoreus]|uniref:Acetylcholinesterase-1 n=1 Tax=Hypsizygus marmoreus TaxID=39966 RepID=A0A369K0J7_HYPMA|nr:Acetylcholinesterase-1 [Hypsizygus marmoreus]